MDKHEPQSESEATSPSQPEVPSGAPGTEEAAAEGKRAKRERFVRLSSLLGLGVIAAVAVGASLVSAKLSDHATDRRQVMDQLTQLEVTATEHSMMVWKALTLLAAEEKMQFIRLRGEAQSHRGELYTRLDEISALQKSGDEMNDWLGYSQDPTPMENLEHAIGRYLGSVQGAYGQMNLAPDRLRERLRYWDMNFAPFKESLEAVKSTNAEIAAASSKFSKRVTTAAGIARLLASALIVFTIGRARSRRGQVKGTRIERFAEQHSGKKLARSVALHVGKSV